ncbi:unnamed protein product [Rotaria magnacalcarata]|uniref:Methyltransferase domain-containing protein n=4 Tax=Rotaria magnacalcarata TaxID=392030 RepID=A0A814UEY4_9BILA|nr:unnamed protein product [Rotaria magnacalcarata]CAF1557833.1 unnamed protein product [Rotaria magnacalcarata]CAF2109244.1 unnamed protein product [Rotaria magnacalcarata]CAF4022087.1 unnamed protein product [Rotaria magnacalcarata]CAF4928856.1 unnamed protein product [Rotaria magnacalcarata]
MTEHKRLDVEDFSNVWKDNQNTLASGLKLDIVEHLLRQRLSKELVDAKQRLIETMKFDRFDNSQEIKILDVGCGLGIDLRLVADEAIRLGKTVAIIGLDQNSTMIEEAKKLIDNQKNRLPSNISIQLIHGDILQMEFHDDTFDIVRADLTLQHVDLPKALVEIRRVLKVHGRLIVLEAGAGNIYSSDEVMLKTYDAVIPDTRDGGTAIRLQFMLPKMNFEIKSTTPMGFLNSGEFLASQDRDWIKIRGMGEMMVAKGVLSKEKSEDFQKRYIEACETNQIVTAGIMFIIEAAKCK